MSSKINCYVKNSNGLYLNRYRSNCNSVRFLLRTSPKLVRKQGKVYLSSKHKRRGYLGGVKYQNRVLSKYLSLCICNYPFYSPYKSLIHRVDFGQFKLSTDIETNPGHSVYVDATKTIHAPYCQGNIVVFGENAGQQCVAMSLCALIYSKIRRITSVDDVIQIMTVGNQLYSSLSLLARQSMLMLTELPEMATVFERFFQLEYSESYTCNMHGDARIEGYHYCMPLETLLALNHNSFILTVGIIGVYFHATDMYGNSHSRAVNPPHLQILRIDGKGMINDVIMTTAHDIICEKNCAKKILLEL